MDSIEVTARFNLEGEATPLSFVWGGKAYPITSVGRRWNDALGQHILVMTPGSQIYELLFTAKHSRWYLSQIANSPMVG